MTDELSNVKSIIDENNNQREIINRPNGVKKCKKISNYILSKLFI